VFRIRTVFLFINIIIFVLLLINTNSIVYTCCIKHKGNVLIVRGDEHDVGDDEVASLDVADVGARVGRLDTTDGHGRRPRTSEMLGIAGYCWGRGKTRNAL
jgi:hypothetical protein